MLAVVLMPVVSLVAPAGAATEDFVLTMTEGDLLLRGAEEPFALNGPTTISGQNADGALSNVVFDTPDISFEQAVTSPVPTTASIKASFSGVSPGTGSIDPDGNVNIRVPIAVDLEIRVALLAGQVFRCHASPIVLNLASVAPHDGDGVRLSAPNFSVPTLPYTDDCTELVGGAVNDQLGGAGHRLSLTVTGALERPLAPGEPTTTSLTVSPAGGVAVGEPVTLVAAVAEEDGDGEPMGQVEFRDGTVLLGTAEIDDDGEASLTVPDLPAGSRSLTARFLGSPPDFAASTSAVVVYRVSADGVVTSTLPPTVRVGGDAVDFDLTVTNPGFGNGLDDVRVDVTIQRWARGSFQPGTGPIGPDGSGEPRVELARVVDGDEEPVPLVHTGATVTQRLDGHIGEATGWSLAAGSSRTDSLRLRIAAGTNPGPLQVTFTLVQLAADTGDVEATLASGAGKIDMVEGQRRPSLVLAGEDDPFFGAPPVIPVAARQGTFVTLSYLRVGPTVDGVGPSGDIEFFIDGRPVLAHTSGAQPWSKRIPATGDGGSQDVKLQIPSDTPAGVRTITASFLGDGIFAPSQTSWPVRVDVAVGTSYDCLGGLSADRFRILVQASVGLPDRAAAGSDLDLDNVHVELRAPRGYLTDSIFFGLTGASANPSFAYTFGPGGTGSASSLTRASAELMLFEDGQSIDDRVTVHDSAGSISVLGDPGEVLAITLDELTFGLDSAGFRLEYTCHPADEADGPATLGNVTAAGTTLAASPGRETRQGESVTLTAQSLPASAGTIEFFAGTETIGHVNAPEGTAVLVVDDLPAGTHQVTARFYGGLTDPTTTSAPVEVVVAPGPECAEFAVGGNGATVRLVYLELLNRCPDQAGFDFWVDRLDSFASTPEQFARQISGSAEAVGVVVDDAYQTMLGRNADASGKAFWVDRMLTGTGRYDHLLADLAASGEFWAAAGGTNEGFVTRVYDRLLHRAPDQPGLDYWTGRLDTGASRRALVLSLANLDEPLGVLVTQSYQQILDRAPDSAERAGGITHLRGTGDRTGLYAELIGQPEFATRAQGFPNLT